MRIQWIIGFLAIGVVFSADWPEWRGPEGVGFVAEGPEIGTLSPNDNLRWKTELPGRANSTPVVSGGKILVTTAIDGKDAVVALDLEGKELWRTTLGKIRPGRGQRVGSSANSSPVTDGERVYVYFKSGALAALSLDGGLLWSLNVFERYGEDKLWWDVGTSPVLSSRGLVLPVMQTDGASNMLCFDKETGEELWKTGRQFEVGKESGDSYTTPHVRTVGGVETIVTHGADHLTGHAADDGRLLWSCGGQNPQKKGMWRVIASAVVIDDIAVIPYGRGEFLAGVKLGGEGDITDSAIAWTCRKVGTDAASPVAWKGKAIVLVDRGPARGKVFCVDGATGEVDWESRLPRGAQTFYASPLVVGDQIYIPREDGLVFSAKLTAGGLEEVTSCEMGEGTIASPAVAGDLLLIRGDKHLFAFAE